MTKEYCDACGKEITDCNDKKELEIRLSNKGQLIEFSYCNSCSLILKAIMLDPSTILDIKNETLDKE